jgi:hypothetical protein
MRNTAPLKGASHVARSKITLEPKLKFPAKASSAYAAAMSRSVHCAANLVEEISLFAENSAAALTGLSCSAIVRNLYLATAVLVAAGVPLMSIWTIEDLVAFDNFTLIAKGLRLCPEVTVLLTLWVAAKYWIQVTPAAAEGLSAVARHAQAGRNH